MLTAFKIRFRFLGFLLGSTLLIVSSFHPRPLLGKSDGVTDAGKLKVFESRRARLMKQMDGGIAVFPGEVRNEYGAVDKRQANYCYYLSGIKGQQVMVILDPESEQPYKLVVPRDHPMTMVWTGKKGGIDYFVKKYKADQAYLINNWKGVLKDLLKGKKKIYYNTTNRWLQKEIRDLTAEMKDLRKLNAKSMLDEMRVIKDGWEVEQLKEAAKITSDALKDVYRFVRPGHQEYRIQALMEYGFRSRGGDGNGFPSIIGGGERATILHYEDNNQLLSDGDLLLMDVGAAVNGYTADITRTIPANGTFTKKQRDIYELVLKGQKEGIKTMLPGRGFNEAHIKASEMIMNGLHRLGLVTDPKSPWQERLYILYRNSHYIGLYVHDVGNFRGNGSKGRILQAGMVLTMEPGIYIHPQMLDTLHDRLGRQVSAEELNQFIKVVRPAFEKYKGIGVRIEDDILITKTGQEIISKDAPKEIKEIEKLMKKKFTFK